MTAPLTGAVIYFCSQLIRNQSLGPINVSIHAPTRGHQQIYSCLDGIIPPSVHRCNNMLLLIFLTYMPSTEQNQFIFL